MTTLSLDKEKGVALLQDAIKAIEKVIVSKDGILNVKLEVRHSLSASTDTLVCERQFLILLRFTPFSLGPCCQRD